MYGPYGSRKPDLLIWVQDVVYNIPTVISNRVSKTRSGLRRECCLVNVPHGGHSSKKYDNKLNLALFNIRSLANKSSSVNDIICNEKLDIIFLTETWLGSDGAALLAPACPANYSFIHSVRLRKVVDLQIFFFRFSKIQGPVSWQFFIF